MASVGFVQMLLLTCFTSAVPAAEHYNFLVTAPHPLAVEIGTDFKASCSVVNTSAVTADDLYWTLSEKKTTVPKERYTKIDQRTLNVSVHVSGENQEWLYCRSRQVSSYVALNEGRFMHAILLHKGYPPKQPENVTCIALQDKGYVSSTIKCSWDTVGRQSKDVPTKYILSFHVNGYTNRSASTEGNSVSVTRDVFPNFTELEIWVEAHNKLGTVESERLRIYSQCLVKTDPPADVRFISEKTFPTSLLLNWSSPIHKRHVTKFFYEIRFCQSGAHEWTYVPHEDIAEDKESFRFQQLQPHEVYVSQVRCKTERGECAYWSEWSANATKRTPEDRPASEPDLWKKVYEGESVGERRVQIICKDPVLSNGRITHFDVNVTEQKVKILGGSAKSWDKSFTVNRTDDGGGGSGERRAITLVEEIHLEDQKSLRWSVAAVNAVGKSPAASLVIPEKARVFPPVEDLKVWPNNSQMWVEWKPPARTPVTEYVVQWVSGDVLDWQRESRSTRRTVIKDDLQKFVCYTVSVYPLYSGWTGKPVSEQVFQEQGVPLEGPAVRLNNKPERNEVELVWTEIPEGKRRGFITQYVVYYTSGRETLNVVVPPDTTTYKLTALTANTKYDVWVRAFTVAGSVPGYRHSFTTTKYASGEIELIVVGVSLGFLFFVIMTMLLCVYKKDVIKRNFWPQIPNPGESTIGNWSPDYPLRAETPKEHCMSGISVLDVDAGDGKSVFEEDKAVLPLKKDKYLSEEHSSGIGGSSCMSSPRQSVSDSDEGGDMVDTTASTVQYSSVVASSGYKGQTPSAQAPSQAVFSRSESTQPLLDSEENPDVSAQDGGRQCFFRRAAGNQLMEAEQPEELETLSFCPLEEVAAEEQSGERPQPSALSSYMPQLGGYRKQ